MSQITACDICMSIEVDHKSVGGLCGILLSPPEDFSRDFVFAVYCFFTGV